MNSKMGDGGLSLGDLKSAGLGSPLSSEKTKAQKGMARRIWNAMGHMFVRNSKEDFEKKLQHLSKEEVAALNRLKRRTQLWRKFARNLILYSVITEISLLGIAIYSTRNSEMAWQTRAWRVLPVFACPLSACLLYTSCARFIRMRERKDQKTLERLRLERQAKIDELKEQTNYYITQQLIQKYDLDPAAKAAAASVLASKLGYESGLKFSMQGAEMLEEEDLGKSPKSGRSNDEMSPSGMRNRKTVARKASQDQRHGGQSNLQHGDMERFEGPVQDRGDRLANTLEHGTEVEHNRGGNNDGGWIARIAAMLVGEDPSQCYALICGKCHMHNGLARKEDFQYITYYCPHCHALNKSNHLEGGDTSDQAVASASPPKHHSSRRSPKHRSSGPEEVFSTSGGYVASVEDTLSNSAAASSHPLETLQEPQGDPHSDSMSSED